MPSDVPFYSNLGELFVGQKRYELSNHLGNVLAVVNDRKNENVTGTTVNFSEPTIIFANDYYPFGLQMDQRSYTLGGAKGHRYGFNGKEKDQDGEWGSNTHYDYGFRIYNPAIAKFLSVDPLTKSYPELTPYQFSSNRPIDGIDLDGLEFLDKDLALVNITYGGAYIKLDKTSNVFKNVMAKAQVSHNTKNNTLTTNFGTTLTGPIRFRNVKAKSNHLGLVDRVLPTKQNTLEAKKAFNKRMKASGQTTLPNSSAKASFAYVAVKVVVYALNKDIERRISNDIELADGQFNNQGLNALDAVLRNYEVIPANLRTDRNLAEITNFVFQGTLIHKTHEPELANELKRAAAAIILREDLPITNEGYEAIGLLRSGLLEGTTDVKLEAKSHEASEYKLIVTD